MKNKTVKVVMLNEEELLETLNAISVYTDKSKHLRSVKEKLLEAIQDLGVANNHLASNFWKNG